MYYKKFTALSADGRRQALTNAEYFYLHFCSVRQRLSAAVSGLLLGDVAVEEAAGGGQQRLRKHGEHARCDIESRSQRVHSIFPHRASEVGNGSRFRARHAVYFLQLRPEGPAQKP
jgi:hypothetical protein